MCHLKDSADAPFDPGSAGAGNVTVNDGGTLGGKGTIAGAVTVASGGAVVWDFDGATGTMLTLQSHLQFDSGWKLALSGSGTPAFGSEYDLFSYAGSFSGTIAGIIDDSAVTGWPTANIGQETGRIYLAFGLSGDADGDGDVDAADYIALKTNMGQASGAVLAHGDFDGNGSVNWADLQILQDNYGATSAGATGTIPEPGSAMLLMFGAAALLRRRRAIVDRIRR